MDEDDQAVVDGLWHWDGVGANEIDPEPPPSGPCLVCGATNTQFDFCAEHISEYETCPNCEGTGKDGPDDPCETCDARGYIEQSEPAYDTDDPGFDPMFLF